MMWCAWSVDDFKVVFVVSNKPRVTAGLSPTNRTPFSDTFETFLVEVIRCEEFHGGGPKLNFETGPWFPCISS